MPRLCYAGMCGSIASHVGRKRLAKPMSVYMIPTATVLAVAPLNNCLSNVILRVWLVLDASALQTFVVALPLDRQLRATSRVNTSTHTCENLPSLTPDSRDLSFSLVDLLTIRSMFCSSNIRSWHRRLGFGPIKVNVSSSWQSRLHF